MTVLSASQLKGLAQATGFTDAQSSVMAAIALAESSGKTDAHNYNPLTGDDSYGCWQINMLGSLGPSRRASLGISDNALLYDPRVNAAAAKQIYSSSGYTAWSTYKNGSYKLFLSKAQKATPDLSSITQGSGGWDWNKTIAQNLGWAGADTVASNPFTQSITAAGAPVGNALNTATDSAGQISRVADAIGKTGNWLSDPTNWLRIGYIVGGGVVAMLALQSLFKPVTSAAAGSVMKAASVLPSGKAAGALSKTAKVMK